MCGIAGLVSTRLDDRALQRGVEVMADAIRHRGPDDAGVWSDPSSGIALGHRRLAVLDLSPAGHQPMYSPSGRFVIVFNGEIYNHGDLRREMDAAGTGPAGWRGHSDTETLLAGFDAWGVEATLGRTVGMFALAVWDCQARILYLARDRFGEKPLYFGWTGGHFAFASELKAIRTLPGFANPLCRAAIADYLTFNAVPAPRSIYEGIFKLEPGCLLRLAGTLPPQPPSQPIAAGESFGTVAIVRWWSLADMVEDAATDPIDSETDAVDALEAQLRDSVRLQCLSDVPLGAFLSGGVDSSAIAALMQQASAPVRTFTVAFEDAGFDESAHAKAVARHLGTQHHELLLTSAETRAVIPGLPSMYDEPFADSSQVPTHLVCRAAREHVTVALSGDGGDELFGGYNRYLWALQVWNTTRRVPHAVRRAAAGMLASASPRTWDVLLRHAAVVRPGEKIHKLAQALRAERSVEDVYRRLVSEWDGRPPVLREPGPAQKSSWLAPGFRYPEAGVQDPRSRMMYLDAVGYLPNDILCKVDRAAMAVSLETRAPFLDHRIAALAWRLPMRMKIRGKEGKWALRQVLYRHVPRELIERPKAGFAVPIAQWLRGPLRSWAESLLDESQVRSDGYLRPEAIRLAWKEHLSGQLDRSSRLWGVLMFQAWLRAQPATR